jgi:hypothetical protein
MQFYFNKQIGRNVEVYVDDINVKSQQSDSLIANMEETFANLSLFNIKLNLEKCTFGVPRASSKGISSPSGASRPTPTRSQPSLKWARSGVSRTSSVLWDSS